MIFEINYDTNKYYLQELMLLVLIHMKHLLLFEKIYFINWKIFKKVISKFTIKLYQISKV